MRRLPQSSLLMRAVIFSALAFAIGNLGIAETASANSGFKRFQEKIWPAAKKRGVSRATFDKAFKDVKFNPEVLKKDSHQPEFKWPASHYIALTVSDTRIEKGTEMLEKHKDVLDRIEKRFKVDRHVVLAIWGMETSFGQRLGTYSIVEATATLAYKGKSAKRRARFRSELLTALTILERGDTAAERMTGSWAGAMGHTQFMPDTYRRFAADFDGDGRRDIWDNIPDALASTANFLKKNGYVFGQTWGYEVKLPRGLRTTSGSRSLKAWSAKGVKRIGGKAFPRPGDKATLYMPSGRKGPAFLLVRNFRAIRRYNPANKYALAIGHLSDRMRGFPEFVQPWPDGFRPLAGEQRKELQTLLAKKGYDIGEIDGVLGSRTRRAVKAYQQTKGLKADGFATLAILKKLREDG